MSTTRRIALRSILFGGLLGVPLILAAQDKASIKINGSEIEIGDSEADVMRKLSPENKASKDADPGGYIVEPLKVGTTETAFINFRNGHLSRVAVERSYSSQGDAVGVFAALFLAVSGGSKNAVEPAVIFSRDDVEDVQDRSYRVRVLSLRLDSDGDHPPKLVEITIRELIGDPPRRLGGRDFEPFRHTVTVKETVGTF